MDGIAVLRALAVRTAFATSLVAGAIGMHNVTGSDHVVATVPNLYDCSRVSGQCWQTNPPHVADVINRCAWIDRPSIALHSAVAVCDKRTAG